jgi:hypothetical protein
MRTNGSLFYTSEHRYIELFLNSTPNGRQNYGPGGGFNGGSGGTMGNMGGGYGDGDDFDESEDFDGKNNILFLIPYRRRFALCPSVGLVNKFLALF